MLRDTGEYVEPSIQEARKTRNDSLPTRCRPRLPMSAAAGRFDGAWNATIHCLKHSDGAFGYVLESVAYVEDGFLRGELGSGPRPGCAA